MRKELILVLIILGILLIPFGNSNFSKISSEVIEKVSDGNVRVMVRLSEEDVSRSLFSSNSLDVKDSFKENIKHDFGNVVSMIVSLDELAELEASSRVESVELEGYKSLYLPQSVPIVNATITWNYQVNSINLTGAGETVCIIDSGANFSHPDLLNKNLTCVIDCTGVGCIEDCSIADDNGHGTHVAGIVGANGGLKGVAPGVNLIAVKACNAAGTCLDSDIKEGIDWCVSNSTVYNISVISMSLGGGNYSSYCDGVDDPFGVTGSINAAVVQNISVIVATGNDNSTQYIGSPACIENATSVGMSYNRLLNGGSVAWSNETGFICGDIFSSVDYLVCWGNRNSITDLIAPGAVINSTWNDGKYYSSQGTSMATPHVAGAFALINQFKRLQGSNPLTPIEIEAALNSTGRQINDSTGTGLNFSRIDVFSAILSLDSVAPNVSLESPLNNVVQNSGNFSFNCSATDLQLANLTLYVWNSSGAVYNNSFSVDVSSTNGSLNTTLLNLDFGVYEWNCLGVDDNNLQAFASSNFTFTFGYVTTALNFPSNNSFTNVNASFNCSAETSATKSLANVTFSIWNSSSVLIYNASNNFSGVSNISTFYYNFSSEGEYYWNCLAYNNHSESDLADSNYTITYDLVSPILSNVSYSASSSGATISFNASELVNVSINYGTSASFGSFSNYNVFRLNHSRSLSSLSASTTYYFNTTSCDRAGNCLVNGTNSFTTSAAETSESTSSGGGGGSSTTTTPQTYTLTATQLQTGYSKYIYTGDQIKFDFQNSSHSVTADSISASELKITVASTPQAFTLGVGAIQKVNLNSDGFYDLLITVVSLTSTSANIKLQEINEEIEVKHLYSDNSFGNESLSDLNDVKNLIEFRWILWGGLLALILVLIALFFVGSALLTRIKNNDAAEARMFES